MAKLTTCKTCGAEIAKSAKVCPHCGAKNKKPIYKRIWFWAFLVIALFILVVGSSESGEYGTSSVGYSGNPKYESMSRDEYLGQCVTMSYGVSYSEIARNPDYYNGQLYAFTGTVLQVMENGNQVVLRIQENSEDFTDDYVWYVTYQRQNGENRILENDTLTVYGECTGLVSYESVLGQTVTIPSLLMKYYA